MIKTIHYVTIETVIPVDDSLAKTDEQAREVARKRLIERLNNNQGISLMMSVETQTREETIGEQLSHQWVGRA